jgi:hypothetical protein
MTKLIKKVLPNIVIVMPRERELICSLLASRLEYLTTNEGDPYQPPSAKYVSASLETAELLNKYKL